MVLHLAHHKSYHPYNAANIARVKADEAAAELEEASQHERASLADSEARIEALRKKAGLGGQKKRKRNDESETALDEQLAGRGWAAASGSSNTKAKEVQSRATIVRVEDQEPEPSHELNGHINFWADYESGRKLPGTSKKLEAEKASAKSKEQEEWEERHTMYLSKPAPEMEPWYAQRDLQSGKSRRRSEDQVLEDTFKDSELKRTHDPLANMEWFLKKRQQRQTEGGARRSRYEDTPKPVRDDGPPLLKARLKRGQVPEWKRRAQEAEEQDEYAPSRPPLPPPSSSAPRQSSSGGTPESEAQSREAAERARALAVKAEAKRRRELRAASSVASTPMSEGGYHDGYNKEVTRGLHQKGRRGGGGGRDGWKSRRWD